MENQVLHNGLDDLKQGPRCIKTLIFLVFLLKITHFVNLFSYVGILLHFSFMV